MILHVIALPHTQTTKRFLRCAYTQKCVKFCKMMLAQGHKVYLYSGDENEASCTKHIPLFTKQERIEEYGQWDANSAGETFSWDSSRLGWLRMNGRAVDAIKKYAEPTDPICLIAGTSQQPIAQALPHMLACEWGVGYEGVFTNAAYESHAWRHHVYGLGNCKNGKAFDTVIPNFFDPDDFPTYATSPPKDSDYLLFIGRLVQRKGPHVATMIAERAGKKLVVAGPGATSITKTTNGTRIECPEITIEGKHLEYVGPVDATQRHKLMANAHAVIVPTLYLEPFGGVAVEAMLSGTPVVASDWGAFPEYVLSGISGECFSTLAEGTEAVTNVGNLDRQSIRSYALSRFSLDAVGPQFTKWFNRLNTLWDKGWYT